MKILVKLILVLLFGAVVLPMWLKGPDGKSILNVGDWMQLPTGMSGMIESASGLIEGLDLPVALDPTGSSAPESSMDAPQGQFYH